MRQKQAPFLYDKNRLYLIVQMTADFKTNAVVNGVFCVCLLFAAAAFFFGIMMFQPDLKLFPVREQQWMGFLQISLSVIFIVIYFAALSLQQIVELRKRAKSIRVLHYIGKDDKQVRRLIKEQIAVKLFMPMGLAFFILLISVPLINLKLNALFSAGIHNVLLKFSGCFILCFLVFYFGYFFAVYRMSLSQRSGMGGVKGYYGDCK